MGLNCSPVNSLHRVVLGQQRALNGGKVQGQREQTTGVTFSHQNSKKQQIIKTSDVWMLESGKTELLQIKD